MIKLVSDKYQKIVVTIISFGLVAGIGYFRFLTGPEYAFSIFYLIPIFLSTWFVNKWMGILVSFLSATSWLLADLMLIEGFANPFVPYVNETFRLSVFLIITFTLSSLKNLLEKEEQLALTDFLTEISNRRYFYKFANIEINKCARYKTPFTLAFLDVDNFKEINDSLGHKKGDLLLCLVADTLKKSIRGSDICSRIGGDEFVVILSNITEDFGEVILNRLKNDLEQVAKNNGFHVTFSIGMVTYYLPPESVDDMLKKVDSVLYTAKKTGKNTIKKEVIK